MRLRCSLAVSTFRVVVHFPHLAHLNPLSTLAHPNSLPTLAQGHASGPTFVYWGNTLALSGGHPWHVQNGADAEWMICVARQQGCFFARKFRPLRTVQQALVQALSEGGGTPKNCDDIVHPAVLSGHSSYGLPVLPPRRPASNSTGVYRADEVLALVASALAAAQSPFVLGRSTTLGVRKGQLHAKALDFAVFYADLPRGPRGCGSVAIVQHISFRLVVRELLIIVVSHQPCR